MTENYFAIERDGKCIEQIILRDENGDIMFEDVMDMSYDELIENNENVQDFVVAAMDATNMYFDSYEDEPTVVTLIGPDDVFIWGIIMEPIDGDIEYAFINWQKDGKFFKYEQENEDFFEKGIDKLN
jgi:hypothetical protein